MSIKNVSGFLKTQDVCLCWLNERLHSFDIKGYIDILKD
jgi:hypothetical protein